MRTDIRTDDRLPHTVAPQAVTLPVRVVGAGLLLATAGIHLYLWQDGYRDIHLIGPAFLGNVVLGVLGAVLVLVTPQRFLPWACLLTGLFELGTLGALLLSLTVGLFGFFESWSAPLVVPTLVVEGAGFLLLFGFAAQQLLATRHRGSRV